MSITKGICKYEYIERQEVLIKHQKSIKIIKSNSLATYLKSTRGRMIYQARTTTL